MAYTQLASDYFEIGIILKPQGVKGELRVFPTTDDPGRFALLDEVTITLDGKPEAVYPVKSARRHKNLVMLSLDGVDDRSAAEALTNGVIKIPPEKALPLDTDEYYIRDLVGLAVETHEGEALGYIREVLATGANDVYVISKTGDKETNELLIPAIKSCIMSVSVPEKIVRVRLPEGLRG